MTISIGLAEPWQAEQIAALINSAYRGETSRLGWTTEADLLDGLRTDAQEIERLLAADDSILLLCLTGTELAGTVHLQRHEQEVHLSMLATNPVLQNQGLGKRLLLAAEQTARQAWSADKSVMSVISCRHELIAFYQRRGYRCTGIAKPFPVNPELWTPKAENLRLEILEKFLHGNAEQSE
ncbi:MAG: GNAT family N-acetyltransferase [Methylobacter sp.]